MDVEYSNKGGSFAYTFYEDEKLLIASLLKKHISKPFKKLDKLLDKYEGQADIAMEIDKLSDFRNRVNNIIKEFSKTKSK